MRRDALRWTLVVGLFVVGMLSTNRAAMACATETPSSPAASSCCTVEPMVDCRCCPPAEPAAAEALVRPASLAGIEPGPASETAPISAIRPSSCVCRSSIPPTPAPRPASPPVGRGSDRLHGPNTNSPHLSTPSLLRVSIDRVLRVDPAPASLAFSTTVRLLL